MRPRVPGAHSLCKLACQPLAHQCPGLPKPQAFLLKVPKATWQCALLAWFVGLNGAEGYMCEASNQGLPASRGGQASPDKDPAWVHDGHVVGSTGSGLGKLTGVSQSERDSARTSAHGLPLPSYRPAGSCYRLLVSSGENMSRPPECLLRLLRGTPRQRVCTLFIISFKFTFFVSIMIYWHIVGEPGGQREFPNLPADVPCPRLVPPTQLSSALPPGNIFFLETSDRTNPNFLFMCSVESAARAHPESRVVVLMKGLPGGNASLPRHLGLSLLGCFPNVHMLPLDLEELFRDTPLAAWYAARQRRWEPYLLPVLSDACRIALMWKFGGIYLDTDFIVLKNLHNLTNTLGAQSRYVLNGAFLAFERHHEFMALCMRDFVAHYNGWIWGHQGPQLLTRVFKKWCSIRSLDESHACRGVTTLPCEAFYPIPWQDWKKYFQDISPEELHRLLNATYAVHVWNKKSQGTRLEATSRALLAQLHARYCPTTHEASVAAA